MKQVLFNQDVRQKMFDGVEKLNQAVSSTLGAKGRHVIIQTGSQYAVTKDGVTVAQHFELPDPVENAAAAIVKDAASRTAREAGDGTTTSTVIAHSAISQAFDLIRKGANPMDLKRGMDKAVSQVLTFFTNNAEQVKDYDDLLDIATISANNDPVVGKMIADIFTKVGSSGAVRIEETSIDQTYSEVIEGCQINAGMISPNFVTNQTKRVADYIDAIIFLTDKKFENSFNEIIPALEKAASFQRPLVIICGGMEGETLGTLVVNKVKNKFPVVAVTAPDFGENRMEILDDLAAMTGATVISEARGLHVETMTPEHFGRADRVICSDKITTIIGRLGSEENIKARVEVIEQQKKEDTLGNQTWRLNKRIASLTSGIGVIYVGGNSDSEMKEAYYRLEDAVAATKAALDEGFVVGGGIAYRNASDALNTSEFIDARHDEINGAFIVRNALLAPAKTIAENCGKDGNKVLAEISSKEAETGTCGQIGYDALRDQYSNLMLAGIIDPVKVCKSAVKNAISVAGMIITTNCAIVNEPKN